MAREIPLSGPQSIDGKEINPKSVNTEELSIKDDQGRDFAIDIRGGKAVVEADSQ